MTGRPLLEDGCGDVQTQLNRMLINDGALDLGGAG